MSVPLLFVRRGGSDVGVGGILLFISTSLLVLEMSFSVYLHVIAPIELSPALRAGVRFLAVHVSVCSQMTSLRKSRTTILADVFPQPFVLQQMFVQECFRRVSIVADAAGEGLRIGVLQHVSFILGRDLKRFVTDVAGIRGRVARLNVLVQDCEARIEIVTETAPKIPTVLQVHASHVAQQSRTIREYFAAILACQILRR